MERTIGTVLVALGIAAVVIGLLVRVGAFSWFGRLPGDLRFEGESSQVFIPITSMLIVSVVLSLLLSFLFNR
ncbi:DUF2905 domain-containing protein [Egibacter rhizosphaerae]|uniref:DUF2905 domain-containing protein n=1 Tax=Egibacter rhizosphaerae TaxID=1670831 RepID=A0A411YGH3_9ACTN|nr:DUF2905 domain-containing protein [Egibacter rhizosphaerae]QBI20318.1 DUF2905 domain-containing protein [Egibacter rhizosphaerae]